MPTLTSTGSPTLIIGIGDHYVYFADGKAEVSDADAKAIAADPHTSALVEAVEPVKAPKADA